MFEITKPSLENAEVTLDETSFTYDGAAKTPAVTVKKENAIVDAGEYNVSYSNSNGGSGNHTNAGTVTVTVTARADGNYSGSNGKAAFIIAPRELIPTITGATTKTYDGGTTCDGNDLSITLEGLLVGDNGNVTAAASYVYADKNVGTGKTINASGITLDGASKDNYTLSQTTATANVGTITKATVSITWGDSPQAVTYNGTQATITAPTVSAENGVNVSVTPKYSYAAQNSTDFKDGLPINAGTYTVRASIVESGNLTAAQADTTLTINKAPLTIDSAAIKTRPYQPTNHAAEVSGVTFTGLVNGETLALGTDYSATGEFDSASAGTGKDVTVTVALADTAKANNYQLSGSTFTATSTITKADPVVTDVSVSGPDPIYESASSDSITLTHGAGDTAGTVTLDGGQTLVVGTKGYAWTFTPTDTNNYNTATGTISLTVAVDALQSIAVTTPPNKTAYTYGESFDKTGMVITATYASGATKVVTDEVEISPDTLTVATTALTITYQGKTTTQGITVSPKTVSAPTIELSPSTFVYDGTGKEPAVTVKDGDKVIPAGEYTVAYSNNVNVGTANVTITDKDGGNYTVNGTTTFTITAKPLTGAKVEATGTFTYTGSALTPKPTVTLDGKTLTENTDYTMAYTDNTDAGTAKITVTGTGNYSGTAQGTFTIDKADLTVEGTGTANGTYGAKLSDLTVSGLTAKLDDTVVAGTWKLVGDTVPNVGDSGEYTAIFTPTSGADNYKPLTAQVTLNIAKADYTGTTTASTSAKFGTTGTYDLSALLPDGATAGTAATTSDIFEGTPAVSGKTLSYALKADVAANTTGTITVPVTSANYKDFNLTITVTVTDKEVPTLSAPMRFCSFSPNRICQKMAGNGVQPLHNYTCRFRPSSLKQADKSGLDGLQTGKSDSG